MSDQAAAVIGANGFLGTALVASLTAAGVAAESFTRDVPFMTSSGGLEASVASAASVYWMASSVNPATADQRPEQVAADQAAFEALLRAAEALDRPPRVVLLSSGGTVYDAALPPPYREDAPTRPVSTYGRAKLALEVRLRRSALPERSKLIVRVSNAYGPGQRARAGQGVVAHWLRAAACHEPLVLIGDPATVRDYVYVDDVADALTRVHMCGDELPLVLNVGSGTPTSLGELAQVVLSVVDNPAVRLEVRPPRSFDLARTWLDVSAARRSLGWSAMTDLADGVAAAWKELRSGA